MIELNRILCAVDFSPFSERALQLAMRIAVWYGAKLQVVHVMPLLPPSTVSQLSAFQRQRTVEQLQSLIERCRLADVDVAAELVESAEPSDRILESADRFDADLLVTGSHGRTGVQRVMLGSVVESLLHRCSRPILAVPSHADTDTGDAFARILCAVDFSSASLSALAFALSLAEEADGRLSLLHVIEKPLGDIPLPPGFDVAPLREEAELAGRQRLEALVPEHARDYCSIEALVVEGHTAQQILQLAAAQRANLIVLGVHGRNVFDLAFFGSNSKDIIRQARCPVLVVPASRRHAVVRAAS